MSQSQWSNEHIIKDRVEVTRSWLKIIFIINSSFLYIQKKKKKRKKKNVFFTFQNGLQAKYYRQTWLGCGRDARIPELFLQILHRLPYPISYESFNILYASHYIKVRGQLFFNQHLKIISSEISNLILSNMNDESTGNKWPFTKTRKDKSAYLNPCWSIKLRG